MTDKKPQNARKRGNLVMAPVQDSPNAQQIEYWNATAGATVTLIHEWAATKLRRAVANSADLRSVANQRPLSVSDCSALEAMYNHKDAP